MQNEAEQKSIGEKLKLLKDVKDGTVSIREVADLIMQKRISWFENNKDMILKYYGMSDEEKALRIIFFDYMKVNPEHAKMFRVGDKKIKTESYNFCPYLEACRQLGLDTRYVCKELEITVQKMCEMINPKLKFSRNYQNIRPHNTDFCEEYFEIL